MNCYRKISEIIVFKRTNRSAVHNALGCSHDTASRHSRQTPQPSPPGIVRYLI